MNTQEYGNVAKRWVMGVGLGALLLSTLACLGSGASAATAGATLAAAPSATPGEDGAVFSFLSPARSSLKSYRSEFKLTYTGTSDDGAPVSGTFTMQEARTAAPAASQLHWEGDGDAIADGKTGPADVVKIGDMTYVNMENNVGPKCVSMGGSGLDDLASPAFSPEMFIGDGNMSNARRILPDETVNGILSQHWQFTDAEVTLEGGWTGYTVDAWAAVDGGYVTRSTFSGDGSDVAGMGGKGHTDWTFDLVEVNTEIAISPPEGCDASTGDELPMMDDASDIITMGAMTIYYSDYSVADVVLITAAKLQTDGWTEGASDLSGEPVKLVYTKDGVTLTISIIKASGRTAITINKK